MLDMSEVRILHGKGNGVLREEIENISKLLEELSRSATNILKWEVLALLL